MSEDKTLVPILCMHRSGSSLTVNVLAELGMALGPFELIGASPHNPHGHFEMAPAHNLDQRLQNLALGFSEDMPESPQILGRLVENEGRWPDGVDVPREWLDQGEELIRGLVASGPVSGFKDPRLPLVWPFWSKVLQRIRGLRVIPLVVLRSPHEIAMSIFMRSRGRFDYGDALDVTAVHFQRMGAILAEWSGPVARVRFLPEYFADDLRSTCRLLGLTWSEEILVRVFDAECQHHESAVAGHAAQSLFEQLADLPAGAFTAENTVRIETDARSRERLLRQNQTEAESELSSTQSLLTAVREALTAAEAERLAHEVTASEGEAKVRQLADELSATKAQTARLADELTVADAEANRHVDELSAAKVEAERLAEEMRMTKAEVARLAFQLQRFKASRMWRLREFLASLPVLKQFANRPQSSASPDQEDLASGDRRDS
jgi:hypothetical protein